jgi:hypothetical protein
LLVFVLAGLIALDLWIGDRSSKRMQPLELISERKTV